MKIAKIKKIEKMWKKNFQKKVKKSWKKFGHPCNWQPLPTKMTKISVSTRQNGVKLLFKNSKKKWKNSTWKPLSYIFSVFSKVVSKKILTPFFTSFWRKKIFVKKWRKNRAKIATFLQKNFTFSRISWFFEKIKKSKFFNFHKFLKN